MKTTIKTAAAVIALTALFAGPASAAVNKKELSSNVRWSLGANSIIHVRERDGVVTLSGYYADSGVQNRAIQAAKRTEGVKKVINLAFPNR